MSRKRITAICLTAVLFFGAIPLLSSGAAPGATDLEKSIDALFDYSNGSGGSYREIPAAEILRLAAGIAATPAEKEYFSLCGITFKLSEDIPAGSVSCRKIDGGFFVTVEKYSYKASNGATVDWIPASVTVAGVKKTFEGGKYEAAFTGLTEGKTYEIKAEFTTKITLPAKDLSTLANAAYDEGQRVIAGRKTYDEALKAYEEAVEKYETAYSAYLAKNNEYTAYLAALEKYNADKKAYDDYIAAKAQYDKDYAAWLAHGEAYEAYEKELAAYEEAYAAYEEQYALYTRSYAALNACRKSMEALESVFVKDSTKRMMYNTLKGDTVAQVVANRSKLVEYGVNEEDVDNAGESTERLIAVLTPYRALKTEREKFEYYKEHYEEIRSQFVRLYQALYSLLGNSMVRMEISKKGKMQRYCQFVSQLYVISTALDDTVSFSSEWRVKGNDGESVVMYAPSDLLDSVQIVTDRNSANPSDLTYPDVVVDEMPVAPVRPTEPVKVDKPQLPYSGQVNEPVGPPTAVEKPKEPEKPTVKRPDAPAFTAQQLALEREIGAGTLKKRTVASSGELSFRAEISKMSLYSADYVFVSFYDHDRTTLLYSEKVRVGGEVSYKGETPAREADEKNVYTFAGWTDDRGKPAVFTNIEEDKAFYAEYTAAPVTYTVTFVIRGEAVNVECVYGDRPVCPKEAVSYSENGKEYIFDGWTPAIALVTENVTYTARFRESDGRYTVSFNVRGVQTDLRLTAGQTPAPPETPEEYIDGMYLYEFSGWSPEISPVTENVVYTAQYEKTAAVPTESGTGAEVTESASSLIADCTGKGKADYTKLAAYAAKAGKGAAFIFGDITVWIPANALSALAGAKYFEAERGEGGQIDLIFTDEEGRTPDMSVPAMLSFESRDLLAARTYKNGADGQEEIDLEKKDGAFVLTLTGRDSYIVTFSYVVQTESIGAGYVKTNLKTAEKGEMVVITVQPDKGAVLRQLYMTANGEKTVLKTNTFAMPDGDVTVTAVFEKTGYVVVFYDGNGGELSRQTCNYGDMPTLPDDPQKEGDEDTVYLFAGWDPEVGPVSGDAEYRPVFKAGAREGEDYKPTPQYGFWTKILPKILVVLLAAGGITAVVIVVVSKKRKKV